LWELCDEIYDMFLEIYVNDNESEDSGWFFGDNGGGGGGGRAKEGNKKKGRVNPNDTAWKKIRKGMADTYCMMQILSKKMKEMESSAKKGAKKTEGELLNGENVVECDETKKKQYEEFFKQLLMGYSMLDGMIKNALKRKLDEKTCLLFIEDVEQNGLSCLGYLYQVIVVIVLFLLLLSLIYFIKFICRRRLRLVEVHCWSNSCLCLQDKCWWNMTWIEDARLLKS